MGDNTLFSEDVIESQLLPDTIMSEKIFVWIRDLYDVTDWRCLLLNNELEREYDGNFIINYLKIFALPYLINISSSERKLGRLVNNRIDFQKICGFYNNDQFNLDDKSFEASKPVIGERTLWHFRKKYENIFSELMVKILILLTLSGRNTNYYLPFVQKIDLSEFNNEGEIKEWFIDEFRQPITISFQLTKKRLSSRKETEEFLEWNKKWKEKLKKSVNFNEYKQLVDQYNDSYNKFIRKTKKGFIEEVVFPIDVKTLNYKNEPIVFRLIKPNYLKKDIYINKKLEFLTESNFQDQSKKNYSKACNILVIEEINEEKHILLSRRISKSGGIDTFALPGGKQKEKETLEECAIRELREETGLVLLKSKPVSIYYTMNNNIQTMSVGVLAEEWDGIVKTMEPNKHEGWNWYDLETLPEPIFEYSKIAINQFLEEKYPNLRWSDFEERPDIQLSFLT